VALPADKVRDPVNREVIFCAAGVLSASPLTYFMRQDDSEVAVFCFSRPEDAEAFAKRFGGDYSELTARCGQRGKECKRPGPSFRPSG
jgi:hypothetical protein